MSFELEHKNKMNEFNKKEAIYEKELALLRVDTK